MKYEPTINHRALIEAVRDCYRIPAESVSFLPVGYAAVCYVVHCANGQDYFLKLWLHGPSHRYRTALQLTRAMHDRNIKVRIAYPLFNGHGTLWSPFSGATFAIFPFLSGAMPPASMPRPLITTWASAMAEVHRATPVLMDVLPPRETFDIACEAALLRLLRELEQAQGQVRPSVQALRALLLPRRDEIAVQLRRLHQLQQRVQKLPSPFVLCHTDMGAENLLIDRAGQLCIVDWDDALVAPPEYDLHEARGEAIEQFLHGYAAAGGARPLHLEHFAFCLLRRHLNDTTARAHRILYEHTSKEEEQEALRGVEEWGFAQWRNLDQTLERFAAALRLYSQNTD